MSLESYIAHSRFGLGPRGTDGEASAQGLLAQLDGSAQFREAGPSTRDALALYADFRRDKKQTKKANTQEENRKKIGQGIVQQQQAHMQLRIRHAASTDTPFLERLALFWLNHFSVSRKSTTNPFIAPYEREAIRPHITGKFIDLLLAVERHPAMLFYLDNAQSIGPNSPGGKKQQKGLNENLAREIMELHTLGVNGGYSQTDVTNFAKVITGWGVDGKGASADGFQFHPLLHEPGAQTILGTRYVQPGEAQGVAVLQALAVHPATAKHIATKLARHFIADDPPQAAVDALAQNFLQTGGDLKALYRTLVSRPEAWQPNPPKIRSSYDLVIAALRLVGMPDAGNGGQKRQRAASQWPLQSLQYLGNVPFTAISPAGFSDAAQDVAGPEALLRRAEWSLNASRILPASGDGMALAEKAIGPIMMPQTRALLASVNDPRNRLAFLLACPEFQRR